MPDKEGWETNVAIAERYQGTGGDSSPLLPVVTLPRGRDGGRARSRAPTWRGSTARLRQALPGARIASYASTGDDAFVSEDRRTTFALVYPTPDPDSAFGENPEAERAAQSALRGATVAGEPVHLTGFDALARGERRDNEGPGVLLEAVLGGVGALVVLTFVFASFLARRPARDGDRLDPDHVPAAARADRSSPPSRRSSSS